MRTCNFSSAKVGDKAWDYNYGTGTVTSTNNDKNRPIKVSFLDGKLSCVYTN